MDKPSEILVERFIRASLNLIPLGIGGIIDQLFYGIKESVASELLKNDIETIKNMINDLYKDKISNDQLVAFVKNTNEYRNIILRIDALEKNKLSIVSQVSSLNLFKVQFEKKIRQNEITQENLEKTIESLNEKNEKIFNELDELAKVLNNFIKANNKRNEKIENFNLKSIKYNLLDIRKTIFDLKESLKLSYKKNVNLVFSDYDINSYLKFPSNDQSIEAAYLCYHLKLDVYPIKILNLDYHSITGILRQYEGYKEGYKSAYVILNNEEEILSPGYIKERLKLVLNKINNSNKIEYDIHIKVDENLLNQIFVKLNVRTHQRVIKNVIKLINFIDKNDKELIYPLNSRLEKNIIEIIKEYKNLKINNESINLYDSKIIALASFYKSVKFKGDIVTSCSVVQKILQASIEDLNFEISEKDSIELLKELKVINSSILSFKKDFKVKVLKPLKSTEKKQKFFNEVFIEFYNAYFPLEEVLQESLL